VTEAAHDLVQITHDAMRQAFDVAQKQRRTMRREFVTAPAIPVSDNPDDPVGKERTRQERQRWWEMTVNDDTRLQALIDDQANKYKLPKEKPIPRSVVDEAVEQWGARDDGH